MKTLPLPPETDRVVLNLVDAGLPEIPLVGVLNLARASAGLNSHLHVGAMEICYLKKGEQIYSVADEEYVLRGNEVFVTFPDEVHGSGHHPQSKGLLYWMQIRLPSQPGAFLGLSEADAGPLIEQLRGLPRRHFHGGKRLAPLFEDIWRIYHEPDRPMRKLALACRVLEWLLAVVECAAAGPSPRRYSPDIEKVLERLEKHPEENESVDALASRIGLSPSRFKAKFKEQVGVPPGEFALRCKVEQAKRMLRDTHESITDIAYQLGFSSSQYFATVYKRFTHRRPSEERGK